MQKRKLYFSCALSGLPPEHRERMIALRNSLSDRFEILEFCDPKEMTPQEIYRSDIYNVSIAHLLLVVVDERATALGYEMGTAVEKYCKPVMAVAHVDALVSPFVIGIDNHNYEFVRYEDLGEVRSLLLDFERRMFPKGSGDPV